MLYQMPSFRRITNFLTVMSVLWICAPAAHANTMYTYTGNTFTTANSPFTTSDQITITFTLTDALAVNSVTDILNSANLVADTFLASVGPFSITDAQLAFGSDAKVSTDNSGQITNWAVVLAEDVTFQNQNVLRSCFLLVGGTCISTSNVDAIDLTLLNDNLQRGFVIGNPGSWSGVPVPEPSTGLLVSLGLLGLVASRRSR